jgi:hypothetical protein
MMKIISISTKASNIYNKNKSQGAAISVEDAFIKICGLNLCCPHCT